MSSSKSVKFLAVTLDQHLSMKEHHKNMLRELKRRTNRFQRITGSYTKPRLDTSTCLKILHSMIVPITTYAPTVNCIKSEKQFLEIDSTVRKAARMAIHAPKSTRNVYTETKAGIQNSKEHTLQLAKSYISNPDRCPTVQSIVRNHKNMVQIHNPTYSTPMDIILG